MSSMDTKRLDYLRQTGDHDDHSGGSGPGPDYHGVRSGGVTSTLSRQGSSSMSVAASTDSGGKDSAVSVSSGQFDELVQQVEALQRSNANLRKLCKAKNKTIYCLRRQMQGFQTETGVKTVTAFRKQKSLREARSRDQLNVTKKGRCKRNLSDSGSIAVALRMSLGCCSALGFPSASWSDISRQTVARCEVNIAAASMMRGALFGHFLLLCISKQKHAVFNRPLATPFLRWDLNVMKPFFIRQDDGNQLDIGSLRDRVQAFLSMMRFPQHIASLVVPVRASARGQRVGRLSIAGISLQNDATNSSIWQRKKLTTAVIHAGMLVDAGALSSGDFNKAFEIHAVMLPDLVLT